LKLRDAATDIEKPLASPPGNGGRGLKLDQYGEPFDLKEGIASRKRGAWIETATVASSVCSSEGHRLPETGGVD